MTKRKNHDGYYVTAIVDGGSANQRTAWLLGPFATHNAALRMVTPARRAIGRHSDDPRFAFAAFGTAKMTIDRHQPFPPGRFDMEWCDDEYIDDVINASRKEDR